MIEHTIIRNLIHNEHYTKRVLPYLRSSYFGERPDKFIFRTFVEYYQKYSHPPNIHELSVEIESRDDLTDTDYSDVLSIVEEGLTQPTGEGLDWLIEKTEEWCQDRAMHNAIMESITIIDGEHKEKTKHSIPELVKTALSISFDVAIGHDYLEDAEHRHSFYSIDEPRIPFDIKMLNLVTHGGCPRKTLNIILAGINVGKTMCLVHFAAEYLKQGKNVLYITLEMAQEWIANRIDANLMQYDVNDVTDLDHDDFMERIDGIRENVNGGRLVVKEYPTSYGHVGHFRTLIDELKFKKKFIPDVILIDYIGIAASARVQLGQIGSYFYVKAVAEEFRGFAVETDTVLWTAVQLNREGFSSSDPDMTNTAESFGLPATADFMAAVMRTDELDALGQLLWKQLKSRYGNKSFWNKFVTGVNIDEMRLFNVDMEAQDTITQDVEPPKKKKKSKSKFTDIEV